MKGSGFNLCECGNVTYDVWYAECDPWEPLECPACGLELTWRGVGRFARLVGVIFDACTYDDVSDDVLYIAANLREVLSPGEHPGAVKRLRYGIRRLWGRGLKQDVGN